MDDLDDQNRKLALRSLGATAAVLTAGSPLGLVAVIPEAVDLLRTKIAQVQQQFAMRFLRDLFGYELPDHELTRRLDDALKKPHVEKAVREAVRTALDALDDHVLPALAALVGHYEASAQEPDSFFRAVCRILRDLSADEYDSLRRIAAGIKEYLADGRYASFFEHQPVRIRGNYARSRRQHEAGDRGVLAIGNFGPDVDVSNVPRAHATRLLHLLVINGFASEVPRPLGMPKVDVNGRFEQLEYAEPELEVDVPQEVGRKLGQVLRSA